MELVQEFVVPRPIDTAWDVLTDVERIAPCMPGAQLTEVEGDTYRGIVKVKVGPVLANFAGQAQFRELDKESYRAVLEARGKEARGQGLATALVTAQLGDEGEQTRVNVVTELTITGRLAQFGRGAMAEISAKLLGQFVECLESTVLEGQAVPEVAVPAAAAPSGQAPRPAAPPEAPPAAEVAGAPAAEVTPGEAPAAQRAEVRRIEGPEATPVDLLRTAGGPILKRAIPVILVAAAIAVVIVIVVKN